MGFPRGLLRDPSSGKYASQIKLDSNVPVRTHWWDEKRGGNGKFPLWNPTTVVPPASGIAVYHCCTIAVPVRNNFHGRPRGELPYPLFPKFLCGGCAMFIACTQPDDYIVLYLAFDGHDRQYRPEGEFDRGPLLDRVVQYKNEKPSSRSRHVILESG